MNIDNKWQVDASSDADYTMTAKDISILAIMLFGLLVVIGAICFAVNSITLTLNEWTAILSISSIVFSFLSLWGSKQ